MPQQRPLQPQRLRRRGEGSSRVVVLRSPLSPFPGGAAGLEQKIAKTTPCKVECVSRRVDDGERGACTSARPSPGADFQTATLGAGRGIPQHEAPGVCGSRSAFCRNQRARGDAGCRTLATPRSHARCAQGARMSIAGEAEAIPANPHAQWLYGLYVDVAGERLCDTFIASVDPCGTLLERLTPAPRRQDRRRLRRTASRCRSIIGTDAAVHRGHPSRRSDAIMIRPWPERDRTLKERLFSGNDIESLGGSAVVDRDEIFRLGRAAVNPNWWICPSGQNRSRNSLCSAGTAGRGAVAAEPSTIS